MIEWFSGAWTIEVISTGPAFNEQFTIRGSLDGDGSYQGVVGAAPVVVSGPAWCLSVEWDANTDWSPSPIRRLAASGSAGQGLVVYVGAANWGPEQGDYDDLVLRLQCTDPDVVPWYPAPESPHFELARARHDRCECCGGPRGHGREEIEREREERERGGEREPPPREAA